MKFGRKYVYLDQHPFAEYHQLTHAYSLPRNQVPEWAGAYINYKGLKKLIKAGVVAAQNGEPVDLAGANLRPAE
jgi:hypothetical protein